MVSERSTYVAKTLYSGGERGKAYIVLQGVARLMLQKLGSDLYLCVVKAKYIANPCF